MKLLTYLLVALAAASLATAVVVMFGSLAEGHLAAANVVALAALSSASSLLALVFACVVD